MDDRRGLPSSSEMWRLSECSGSKILTESLRAKGISLDIPNVYATLGERIHASLEGYDVDLSRRAEEIRDDCDKLAVRAASEFLGARESLEAEQLVEVRLWYNREGVPFFSGRPDRVSVRPERILDVNFKTGTSAEEDAVANLQMRSEVVLLHDRYPQVPEIGVLLSQPLATRQPEIVIYDQRSMGEAETEILGIVDRATWDPSRRAGPWCKFCPARAWCPQARELAMDLPLRIKGDQLPELPSGPAAAEMMAKLEVAYDILGAVWEAFQKKVQAGGDVPGWQISTGKKERLLPDHHKSEFIDAVVELGFTLEDIDAATKFSIPKFEDIAAKKWGLKGAALRRRFAIYFEEFFEVKQHAGFLQRIPLKDRS
jgi:hypothetical protein